MVSQISLVVLSRIAINFCMVARLLRTLPVALFSPNNKHPSESFAVFPECMRMPSKPFTPKTSGNIRLNLPMVYEGFFHALSTLNSSVLLIIQSLLLARQFVGVLYILLIFQTIHSIDAMSMKLALLAFSHFFFVEFHRYRYHEKCFRFLI